MTLISLRMTDKLIWVLALCICAADPFLLDKSHIKSDSSTINCIRQLKICSIYSDALRFSGLWKLSFTTLTQLETVYSMIFSTCPIAMVRPENEEVTCKSHDSR